MLTHDFAVSVMVQTPGQQVMGTLLYQFSIEGAAPMIAVMSLFMTLITAGILALTTKIAGKSALEGI
jgi:iron(III) transport system permease protein